MPTPITKKTTIGRTLAGEIREDQVRRWAHELCEARGRGDGHDVDNWLDAEAETDGGSKRAAA